MPRRRGGGFGFGKSSPSPSRGIGGASRPISTAPSRAPPAPMKPQVPATSARPSHPSVMSQIASTAAGVAIGHTVGHAMVGGMSGGASGEEIQQAAPPQGDTGQQQQQAVPCARELEDFIKCTQTNSDLKFCEGLNYMFKQCKTDQGFA